MLHCRELTTTLPGDDGLTHFCFVLDSADGHDIDHVSNQILGLEPQKLAKKDIRDKTSAPSSGDSHFGAPERSASAC